MAIRAACFGIAKRGVHTYVSIADAQEAAGIVMSISAQDRLQASWPQWIKLRTRTAAGRDAFYRAIEDGMKMFEKDCAHPDKVEDPSSLSENRILEYTQA